MVETFSHQQWTIRRFRPLPTGPPVVDGDMNQGCYLSVMCRHNRVLVLEIFSYIFLLIQTVYSTICTCSCLTVFELFVSFFSLHWSCLCHHLLRHHSFLAYQNYHMGVVPLPSSSLPTPSTCVAILNFNRFLTCMCSEMFVEIT